MERHNAFRGLMGRSSSRFPVSSRTAKAIAAGALVLSIATIIVTYLIGFGWGPNSYVGTGINRGPQVYVSASHLRSADFTSGGTTTVVCGQATGSYLVLSNNGTVGTSVTSVTIDFSGTTNRFALSEGCAIGAYGSATAPRNVLFPPTSMVGSSAIAGESYTGSVNLANGAILIFSGRFQ